MSAGRAWVQVISLAGSREDRSQIQPLTETSHDGVRQPPRLLGAMHTRRRAVCPSRAR